MILRKQRCTTRFLLVAGMTSAVAQGQDRDRRIADLERQLAEAKGSVAALQKTIESLSEEVQALHGLDPKPAEATVAAALPGSTQEAGGAPNDPAKTFAERIIGPDLGSDERDHMFEAKPEVFIQTRYSVAPVEAPERRSILISDSAA